MTFENKKPSANTQFTDGFIFYVAPPGIEPGFKVYETSVLSVEL